MPAGAVDHCTPPPSSALFATRTRFSDSPTPMPTFEAAASLPTAEPSALVFASAFETVVTDSAPLLTPTDAGT